MENYNYPGIVEEITDWPEGSGFGASPEEVNCALEALTFHELPEN